MAVAVPFSGPGLWGGIEGVMALEPDLVTIRGVRFYKQEETPGLGGEIGSDTFQNQFAGKRMISPEGVAGFRIVKPGTGADVNSVDGISGATLTGKFLTQGLKDVLTEYEPVSITFRNKKKYCLANKNVPWCRYEAEKK